MDPNQQPQDPSTSSEPTPFQFGAPEPAAPQPEFTSAPEPATPMAGPTPEQPTPQVQPFGQPAEANQTPVPQPAFPSPEVAPVSPQQPTSGENPGQTLGIVSIVLSIIGFSLIGLVLGVISRKKSKAVGASTTLGTIGMVLGIIFTVVGFLFFLLIAITAYAGIQEAARNDAYSNNSAQANRESTLMEANADTVVTHAEAYYAEKGDYPKTTSDFSKYPASTLPDDIKVYSSLLLTNSSLTYIYCGTNSAQVVYLGDNADDKHITSIGAASSTEVCPKAM